MSELQLSSLLLAGAVAAAFIAAPAHAEPVKPETHHAQMSVRFHFVSERQAMTTCSELGAWGGRTITRVIPGREVGCAVVDNEHLTCDIYTPEPREDGDAAMLNLGHEAYHCATGKFHD